MVFIPFVRLFPAYSIRGSVSFAKQQHHMRVAIESLGYMALFQNCNINAAIERVVALGDCEAKPVCHRAPSGKLPLGDLIARA